VFDVRDVLLGLQLFGDREAGPRAGTVAGLEGEGVCAALAVRDGDDAVAGIGRLQRVGEVEQECRRTGLP
jgi:hypothetical protein